MERVWTAGAALILRRQTSQALVCLHITERLQAGVVTIVELVAETIRLWTHLGLKQRAVGIVGRIRGFHFEDQLHIARMLKMTKGEEDLVNSHWLAALYLLSAHADLWQKTITAVELDGQCLCLAMDTGKVRYWKEDVLGDSRSAALNRVTDIVRTTAEYMS